MGAAYRTVVVGTDGSESSFAAVDRAAAVAGDAGHFAQSVVTLLNDVMLQRRIGAAGRRYVEREHRWTAAASAWSIRNSPSFRTSPWQTTFFLGTSWEGRFWPGRR